MEVFEIIGMAAVGCYVLLTIAFMFECVEIRKETEKIKEDYNRLADYYSQLVDETNEAFRKLKERR